MRLTASDIIAMVSAVLATLALFIGIYAAVVTQRVATSGFQASEKVKTDTATLLAALRGIMIKAVLYSQQDPKTRDDERQQEYIDIRPEKTTIQGFLNSPTAIAYYAFVAKKSKSATEAGREGEDWRLFFLRLGDLLHTGNTYSAGVQAATIEKMFDKVSDSDVDQIASNLEELPKSIKGIMEARKSDALFYVLVDNAGKQEPDFRGFIKFLRNQHLQDKDPDIDLFWAVIEGDLGLTKDSLARGAKVNVTQGEIEKRYKDLWDKYKSTDQQTSTPSVHKK